jgi:peptide/nickel transport system permease protein
VTISDINSGNLRNKKSKKRSFRRRFRISISASISIVVVALVIVAAVAAPLIAPFPPNEQHIVLRLRPPSWLPHGEPGYIFGTDTLGRDIFSRIIYGARISLVVGFSSIFISGLLGVFLGLIAAYFQGFSDTLLSTFADIQQSIPFIALLIALAAVIGPSLQNVILILGITGWVVYYRVMRADTLSIKQRYYIEASRALGANNSWIIIKHIFPNSVASIMVIGTLLMASVITGEAGLSFLGLGIPPIIPTWGNMIADGREYLQDAWWLSVFPGVALSITVLGVNLIGDWLRDLFDPRYYS